jgi:catecholate siderophore receptor
MPTTKPHFIPDLPQRRTLAIGTSAAPLDRPLGSLRPEAAARFGRAAVTSVATAALVNAMAFTGNAQAQDVAAPTTPTKKKADASEVEGTLPDVVVVGDRDGYKPETVSSTKYTEPLRDIPQSITVVPRAVIEQQNATNLRDVLRNVPGISLQAGEGGGGPGGDFLSIRGFNARNDIFIDGVRDFGGYSRDAFNMEQVEVVKGPASTYTGRGSTGGSVNVSSKAPRLDNAFYNLTLGVGTEEYKRGTIDINQPIYKHQGPAPATDGKAMLDGKGAVAPTPTTDFAVGLRLNAMWMESDIAGRDEVEYSRWGIAPSLAFEFGEDTRLTLSYFHLQQDNQPDYGIPWVPNTQNIFGPKLWNKPSPVDYSNYYGLLDRDYEEIRTDLGTLQFETKAGDWMRVRNIIRYGQTTRDSVTTAPRYNTSFDPSDAMTRQFQSRDQTDTIISEQFDVRFSFETFGVKHELVTGFDYAHETAENNLRAAPGAPPADVFNPNPHQKFSGPITYTGAVNESTTDNIGLFLFDTLKFGKHWELSGGVRWDYYDADLDQRAVNGVTTSFGRLDKIWSYRVALAYKPVEIGTIYAAYGTSFNPSAEGAVSLAPLTDATAALEPEENRTFEVGTKWDLFDEKLSLTAAVFRTEKTNARTPGLTPDDPPTVLDGEQQVQGFEIGIAGSITEHWKVFGGYTFLDSEIKKSNTRTAIPGSTDTKSQVGNELPQTPQHSFSLWTTYSLPWEIEIGAGAQYVGSRYSSTDNLREAPDYWLFDAMISKQITKNIKAQLNVYNLADEEYIDRVGGGHFIPGAGRTGVFSVSFTF